MQCNEFRDALEGYLADTLTADDRMAFREHLGSCEPCRNLAVAEEPTLMFAAMPERSSAPEEVDRCVAAVSAMIRQERLQSRLRSPRRGWLAAAAALVLVIGGSAAWQMSSKEGPALSTPMAQPAAALEMPTVAPPRVEVDMGEGVRVYQYAEQEDENTAVYFIVNSALES
jgi:predicted anti-sigma-YlaC factor YlaD